MSDNVYHINRREFIAAGSVAVVGLTLPAVSAQAATAPAAPLPLSVGFWGGVPRIARRFISQPSTFEAATSVFSGDGSLLSSGARLSFRGIHRAAGSARLSVLIDVTHQIDDGTKVPFFAFTHVEGGLIRSSSASSFTVPVPTQGTIDLSIRARRGSDAESAAVVSFAVNSADGALKLNRGVYVFALTEKTPRWRSIRIGEAVRTDQFVTGGPGLLVDDFGGGEVDFDYIVMTAGAAPPEKA